VADKPEGARRWIAALAKQYMDVLSEQPGAGEKRREFRRARSAAEHRVRCLAFCPLLGNAKSGSLARRASESFAFQNKKREQTPGYNIAMPKPPKVHSTRLAEGSHFLKVELIDLEFSNGERRTYERLKGSGLGAVIIVPMLDNDTVLLVREYGAGIDRYELGLPKGRLDRDETVEQGANRELKEEVGYGARDLHILTTLSLSPSYMTSMTHVVLARDLYPERLPGDEPEELEVVGWKLSELHELIGRPDVSEGRSIAALFIAREYLAGRFVPRP